MLDTTAHGRMQAFLDRFGEALEAGDIEAVTAMFQADSYWRDLVTFTWNIKTVEGREEVADMLRHQLETTKPSGWRIADGEEPTEEGGVTTAWIRFETAIARGYGLIRLKDGAIWTLLTTMVELKGLRSLAISRARSAQSTAPSSTAPPGPRSARRSRRNSATGPSHIA